MTWFAVDDSLHGHPKLADLEAGGRFAEAIALWTVAGSWCASHLTDGRVPAAQLRKLVPFQAAKAAAELVRVGLWSEVDGGFQFRDWTHYQPTKEEVEERRSKGAARTRKSRQQARERALGHVTDAVGNGACNGVTNAERALSETLSRPVPSRPVPSERETRAPETPKHMSRFADSFTAPSEPIAAIAARFSDARHSAGFGRWTWDGKGYGPDFERLTRILAALDAESDLDRDTALEAALRGLFADPKARDVRCPLAWLANDAGGYIAAGRSATETPASKLPELYARQKALNAAFRAANDHLDRCPLSDRPDAEKRAEDARNAKVAIDRQIRALEAEAERRSA